MATSTNTPTADAINSSMADLYESSSAEEKALFRKHFSSRTEEYRSQGLNDLADFTESLSRL